MNVKIVYSEYSIKCLDNEIKGIELYKAMEKFTEHSYRQIGFDYDSIIVILRAGLPLGLKLYELSGKPIGFISAKRNKDLSIDIGYKNIPEFRNPLIVDSWIATGSTVEAVKKELRLDEINLFGLIITKHALNKINPINCAVGFLADELTPENYIIPPYQYEPRDGGDDLFSDF